VPAQPPPRLGQLAYNAARVARIDSFLRIVADQQASDLHFHAGNRPIIRQDGDIVDLPFRVLSAAETERFLFEILNDEQQRALAKERQVDLVYGLNDVGRFRVNVFSQNQGLGAVFRIIPAHKPTIDELQLPSILKQLTRLSNGLIIVSGPTGAGKTTTLAALIHEINTAGRRHIITIEDPVEFVHDSLESVVTQREVGHHVSSFASGLRSALRESPDVLVLGEMRDQETVQLALSATETGVLVLATLHTNSAPKAIDRILDLVSDDSREQARGILSVMLRAVIAQHLVKRANGEGRIAATEVLLQSLAVANMIRENKVHQIPGHLQTASFDGSGAHSLDSCLLRLIREGMVALEEALTVADHPEQLSRQVAELPEDR
jgi:twitching motility protein PilT